MKTSLMVLAVVAALAVMAFAQMPRRNEPRLTAQIIRHCMDQGRMVYMCELAEMEAQR